MRAIDIWQPTQRGIGDVFFPHQMRKYFLSHRQAPTNSLAAMKLGQETYYPTVSGDYYTSWRWQSTPALVEQAFTVVVARKAARSQQSSFREESETLSYSKTAGNAIFCVWCAMHEQKTTAVSWPMRDDSLLALNKSFK